ncbi:phage holin family protein [Lacticaseibacillus baoqingensis]|uniref:Phage holin family protein n=1 Tax=Lacticaseibacillus baoqingensis TaxID=2486013 RepID=A0ABW4E4P5_9LACO|nr:phage holin family protein [Lacticaseibacillus baoqingensis]
MTFIRKVLLTTIVFVLYAQFFPSQLYVAGWATALVGALVLGVLNGLIRPIIKLLSLPLTILSFGLFLFVINGFMLEMMTWFVGGIAFSGFGSMMLLALVISLVNLWFGESSD